MNTVQAYIRGVAEMMGKNPGGAPVAFEFLNTHGKVMTAKSSPLTETMPLGQCYQNAYTAQNLGPYLYCEGFAAKPIGGLFIPMNHAWLMDEDGLVIDPTWPVDSQYFGVAFSAVFLDMTLMSTGYYSVFDNLYRLKMPPEHCLDYLLSGLAEYPA